MDRRYLNEMPRGERPGQRHYNTWVRRTDGASWSSNFDRHGGWATALARASGFAAGDC
ncbi:MAG: hypothetical protein WKF96_02070 [Solirubrobacteraceae bacterium]